MLAEGGDTKGENLAVGGHSFSQSVLESELKWESVSTERDVDRREWVLTSFSSSSLAHNFTTLSVNDDFTTSPIDSNTFP
jgi:hypothetical protein